MRELLFDLLAVVTSAVATLLIFVAWQTSVAYFVIAVVAEPIAFLGLVVLFGRMVDDDLMKIGVLLIVAVVISAGLFSIEWQNLARYHIVAICGLAIFAGVLVFLGETIIDDTVKIVFAAVVAVLVARSGKLEILPPLSSAIISGLIGMVFNQVNKSAANKALNRMPTSGADKP